MDLGFRHSREAHIPGVLDLLAEKGGTHGQLSLSLLQLQSKMERTTFRAWNHWTSLSPLFLPLLLLGYLRRLNQRPKAKMEKSIDNTERIAGY